MSANIGVNTAMVYIELKRESEMEPGSARRWVPLLLSLVAVLFGSVATLNRSLSAKPIITTLRPLEKEEREAVIFDLDRLRDQSQNWKNSSTQLSENLIEDENVFVDSTENDSAPLIHRQKSSLVFAVRFFQSDSGEQEAALKRTLVEMYPATSPNVNSQMASKDLEPKTLESR